MKIVIGMLDRSAVTGEALLLVGEPGIGKTALLQAAADHAQESGTRVLHAAGAESDDVSLSGLTPAIMPLMTFADHLSEAQRRALSTALGLVGSRLPRPAVVSQAALALLLAAAQQTPTLLVVDDLQWLDPYSGQVLGFLARRVGGGRVGLLAACRSAASGQLYLPGVPRHDIAALEPEASDELLRSRFPALAVHVRRRLVDDAQGNPLALLELPSALSGRQRAALQELPSVLPIGERLQAVFASRIATLPEATRDVLLLAALEGRPDLHVLTAASGRDVLGDLAAAERERLLQVDNYDHRVVFRHPLTRSAVLELSTAAQRRAAHAALAEALVDRPERRAPHLCGSADKPDERVAGLLEECASRLAHRGEAAAAVSALTRAADLSPAAVDRSRRLAQAAFIGSDMAWQFGAMTGLLDEARDAQLDPSGALLVAAAAAVIMANGDYDFEAVHRLLNTAIEAHAGGYEVTNDGLRAAVATLSMLCLFAGKPELWAPCVAAIARLSPAPPLGLHLQAMTQFDPVRTALSVLTDLDAAIVALNDQVDPEELLRIPTAAVYVDRLAGCRSALRRQIADAQGGGAAARTAVARMNLWVDAYGSGRWDEAQQLAREGLDACNEAGAGLYAQISRFQLALLAAVRGDEATNHTLTQELAAWATPRGARLAHIFAWHARGLAALGRGDFEEAFQNSAAISPPGTFPPYEATALWVCLDLVEAAALSNRRSAAQDHVAAMDKHQIAAISPRLALITHASAGVAADGDVESRQHFERALAIGAADRWPFDKARVQLAYGRRLSQAKANLEARAALQAALATFEQLKARPWANRTAQQLRSLSARPTPKGPGGTAKLTAQELEIAQLAAQGYTNKQIGAQLHLSPRTVSTHLYRLFPKLGITTRAALRDALTNGDISR